MTAVIAVPDELALELYAGDNFNLKVARQDASGAPLDLSGTIKGSIKDTLGAHVVDFTVDDSEVTMGVFVISLDASQTRALFAQGFFRGYYDVQWTDPMSSVQTLFRGTITCSGDVTT